jgi:hypothetical protein
MFNVITERNKNIDTPRLAPNNGDPIFIFKAARCRFTRARARASKLDPWSRLIPRRKLPPQIFNRGDNSRDCCCWTFPFIYLSGEIMPPCASCVFCHRIETKPGIRSVFPPPIRMAKKIAERRGGKLESDRSVLRF